MADPFTVFGIIAGCVESIGQAYSIAHDLVQAEKKISTEVMALERNLDIWKGMVTDEIILLLWAVCSIPENVSRTMFVEGIDPGEAFYEQTDSNALKLLQSCALQLETIVQTLIDKKVMRAIDLVRAADTNATTGSTTASNTNANSFGRFGRRLAHRASQTSLDIQARGVRFVAAYKLNDGCKGGIKDAIRQMKSLVSDLQAFRCQHEAIMKMRKEITLLQNEQQASQEQGAENAEG
ncbi:hypothetical protein BJ508DRAFT_332258 [Ascobolus immersus RN42]|uniref:Uncharacterized protein n=1 Tax=Ascobolus immersus RN42 TaxID=1160509 RepID=A0A3N4I086_ASCIM|nr:hypothetical protein BJ508DRAFT_332258 [Ascobolus immersus RN42]